MSATLVIEYDRVFDPAKDSYWKQLDSLGSFLACLIYTWVSPTIHLLYLKRSVLGLKWSREVGKLGLHSPLWAANNQDKRCFKCMSDASEKKHVLQRHINLTNYPWKLDNASGFCSAHTLRFHQRTSVDVLLSFSSHQFPHKQLLSRFTQHGPSCNQRG